MKTKRCVNNTYPYSFLSFPRKRESRRFPFFSKNLDSRFSAKGRSASGGRGNDRDDHKKRKHRSLLIGFTLIELVIYIGIAGGVLVSFTLFILNIAGTRNKTLAVSEVQTSGRIALAAMSARIRNATGVNASASVFGTDPGIISLRMDDFPAQNPTIIRLSQDNGFLQIQEGTNAPIQITSPLVRVTHLSFTNTPLADTKKNILIRLVIEYGNPLESQIITNSLWDLFVVPGVTAFADSNPVELGVRFTSDTAGYIRGIRFYKGPTNTNTHTGRLWANTGGTPLGMATFTSETAFGWQEASFNPPIAITANTPYIASYHAPNGNYAADTNYFLNRSIDKPPLHAPANTGPTPNGVFIYYGGSPPPPYLFPNLTFNSLNYWVDVVFSTQGGLPTQGDASFVHSQRWETSVSLRQETDISLWSPYATPGITSFIADPNSVELGVRFTSDVAGYIRGIRFYKGNTNTSTHTGRLWANTGGTPLGTATFTGETASGWQEASFNPPIFINANTLYIASYYAPNGNYAADTNYFATMGIDRPPLHAPVDQPSALPLPIRNGVFIYYGAFPPPPYLFPNTTFNSSNYWVDVVFSTTP